MGDKEKFSQFELRLKLWNYFKYGSDKLLQHMKTFNQEIRDLEEKNKAADQKESDDKIKKQILQLESKISQNIHDIKQMRTTLDAFEKKNQEFRIGS